MSITPTVRHNVFVEKYFESWEPKIHGPRSYIQGFYVATLIDKYGTTQHYQLEMYQNVISKEMISYVTGKTDDGIPSSSSDSTMTSKKSQNRRDTFKFQMKNIVYLSEHRMRHCLGIG